MPATLAIWLFCGLAVLIVVLLAAVRRWTASKQQRLSAEEFRRWFQRNYLGMETDSVAQASPGDSPARTRKASAASSQGKRAS